MGEPTVWRFLAHEDDYPDLDAEGCAARLAGLVSCRTVAPEPGTDGPWDEFDRLRALLGKGFPHVFAAGSSELVGHSLLVTIPGSDPALAREPLMLIAHQDVVPVAPGTEGDWEHGAFDGYLDETYVWGRGTIDMKDQLAGELEAVEYALSHGWSLARGIVLAFGEDEERAQTGAQAMGELLEARGVRPFLLLDEGAYRIARASAFGAPHTPFMQVNLAEKGYVDVMVTARGALGHSANPFGGTSLAAVCAGVAAIAAVPWPVELTPLVRETFSALAPHITEGPLAPLVSGGRGAIDDNAREIAAACLAMGELFPLVSTTCAPTMLVGGSPAPNVLPRDVTATINFRPLEGVTPEGILERCREACAGLPVEVELGPGAQGASATSSATGEAFATLARVAARYFGDPEAGEPVTLVPTLATSASDARKYERICDSCLRFSAFVVDDDECSRGLHGTNERITRRAYLQGIRTLVRLVEEACVRG